MRYIVTHPGQAHRDDFLAVCLLLGHHNCVAPVFRREPTTEELEDPEVWVLDVGQRHEPAKHNFDHHQPAIEGSCAFSLLAEALGHAPLFELQAWYRHTVLLDSCGPVAAARALGLSDIPQELESPLEKALLGLLGGYSELIVDTTSASTKILDSMRCIGLHLIRDGELFAVAFGSIDKVQSGPLPGLFTRGQCRLTHTALERYRKVEAPQAAFYVAASDRPGESWMLFRFADHPRIDFLRIQGDPRVVFAHPVGFVAKLRVGATAEEALELVVQAVKP